MDPFPGFLADRAQVIAALVKLFHQFIPALILPVPEDCGEFIPADPENGAVGEDLADDGTGALQVKVALVMTVFVVDHLQVIAVKEAYGKRRKILSLPCVLLQVLQEEVERAQVAHRRQRIPVRQVVQVADIAFQVRNQLVEGGNNHHQGFLRRRRQL